MCRFDPRCACMKVEEPKPLTGIERAGLQDIVDRFAVLGPDDQPDPNEPTIAKELLNLRGEVDENGMVHYFPREGGRDE